jgi:hypothetical protein
VERFENLQFSHKRSVFKIKAREVMVAEEIRKNPISLHENNRKDALRASQELSRPHP